MKILRGLLCAVTLIVPSLAAAQDYPAKPVTIVVPFAAGGAADNLGRFLGERLGTLWGEAVIIDNRPGAGTSIGAAFVAEAEPDGHTLLWVTGSLLTTAATRKNLPFSFETDLQPVAVGAVGSMIIVTGSRTPLPTLDSLVAAAKAQPVFYGTTGVGGAAHFAAEVFSNAAGIKMEPVHYKGGSEALLDLAGGRVDVYAGSVTSVLSAIQSGQATAVAAASTQRSKLLPDVPTLGELGYAGAETGIWWGLFAPAGTPMEVVEKINADLATITQSDEAKAFLDSQGAEPGQMSVQDFSALVMGEYKNYKTIADKLGLVTE